MIVDGPTTLASAGTRGGVFCEHRWSGGAFLPYSRSVGVTLHDSLSMVLLDGRLSCFGSAGAALLPPVAVPPASLYADAALCIDDEGEGKSRD